MDKKTFLKRMGQLYAQGIQYGFTPEQMFEFAETVMKAFIQPKKDEYYNKLKKEKESC